MAEETPNKGDEASVRPAAPNVAELAPQKGQVNVRGRESAEPAPTTRGGRRGASGGARGRGIVRVRATESKQAGEQASERASERAGGGGLTVGEREERAHG